MRLCIALFCVLLPVGAQSATAAPPAQPAARTGGFSWLVEGRLVVDEEVKPEWAQGRPRLVSLSAQAGTGYAARRGVHLAALPQGHEALIGRRVRAYSLEGPVCEAAVSGLTLFSWVDPHFGTVDEWKGRGEDDQGRPRHGRPWSGARIAAAVWESGARLLLGDLGKGGCAGALWALPAEVPPPRIVAAAPAGPELVRAAWTEVRKLPAYQKIQKEYADFSSLEETRTPRWEDYRGPAEPEVKLLRHPAMTILSFDLTAGDQVPCTQDFYGHISALWEVQGDPARPRLVLRSPPDGDADFTPGVAVDLDGDGQVELLDDKHLLRLQGGTFRPVQTRPTMPSYDCPC